MKESVLQFSCEGEPLVGILAEPDGPAADIGVLIIVGGPQYRAGSHRQFTLLARHLAQKGFVALRFDYRGMGDSGGAGRDFEAVEADITAAIEALMQARPAIRRVALWGLCDAASAALMYVNAQPASPLAGLMLANPWVRSTATLAATHVKHYYGKRVLQMDFWRKLLLGGIGLTALKGLLRNLLLARSGDAKSSTGSFQSRMADSLARPSVPMLLLLSTDDLTSREFSDMFPVQTLQAQAVPAGRITHQVFEGADHTFSSIAHYRSVLATTSTFLGALKGEKV